VKLQSFSGFRGKAATLQVGKITFMVLARNPAQLEKVCNFILKESGQTLLPEMIVPGIIIHSSVLPKPTKPKTTNEQSNQP
jgi:hypothetical protein